MGRSYYVETLTDEIVQRHGSILRKLKVWEVWQKQLNREFKDED